MGKRKKQRAKHTKELKQKSKKQYSGRVPRFIVGLGWSLVIGGICFGVYNNVTATSTHTVHEVETIKEKLTDTTGIESFTTDFVKTFFTISPNSKDQGDRQEKLVNYLADDLNASSLLYKELKEETAVQNIDIWKIDKVRDNIYSVSFKLSIESSSELYDRAYAVEVYAKDQQFAIVKLPVLSSLPEKAVVISSKELPTSAIETTTRENVEGFLETFFAVYPKADKKELLYYGNDLQPIQENLSFLEINNPQMYENSDSVEATCTVTYKDNDTQMIHEMFYELTLKKLEGDKFSIKELR
ncbi:conjugal transfer protein [Candidatus Enterococcus clewellii]|uniref:Conjugative transposon protein n=1 Tax=Candidatus Enterococcus clewellii TaxID=1834193 RepID=A0A242K9H2_9ENTE|nr:conjugal transfer protein [Enterococcus sp. 9E7_DIV0242]OTP17428.1 hypothetical protein A5888_001566 [Enterococcus sp. 9E7_DIV0242]